MPPVLKRALQALAQLATAVGVAACDPAISPAGRGASPDPTAMPASLPTPATPPPPGTTRPEQVSGRVATPTPGGIATPLITPTPVRPEGAVISPPPSSDPAATPSASPEGGLQETGRPLDLAPSGPVYFVLATRERPTTAEELLFTRVGPVELVRGPAGAREVLRPRLFGLHLLGFMRPATDAEAAPDEAEGPTGLPVETRWASSAAPLRGLALDADRNPGALTASRVDLRGAWLVADATPRDVDGSPLEVLLALASFEAPTGLDPVPGLPGVFRWAPAAGRARLGVAMGGPGRVLGNRALVVSGRLVQE
ncbi:MAG: hypothetical protein VKQ33_01300 [Candidatus Sericytochromatia bacterium]|nr:hypothetical protein [Candidatus Sericytochromatia bacterium]